MNENFSDSGDEILEASFAAMRGRTVPDGPPEARIAETIAAMSLVEQKPNSFWRMNNMKFITGMAASFLLVLGAVVVAVMMLRSPEATFAEVVETVRNTQFMSCVISTEAMGKIPANAHENAGQRSGATATRGAGQRYANGDGPEGRPHHDCAADAKSVFIMDLKNMPKRNNSAKMIDDFKNLQGDSAKDLGKTDIDGKWRRRSKPSRMDRNILSGPTRKRESRFAWMSRCSKQIRR